MPETPQIRSSRLSSAPIAEGKAWLARIVQAIPSPVGPGVPATKPALADLARVAFEMIYWWLVPGHGRIAARGHPSARIPGVRAATTLSPRRLVQSLLGDGRVLFLLDVALFSGFLSGLLRATAGKAAEEAQAYVREVVELSLRALRAV